LVGIVIFLVAGLLAGLAIDAWLQLAEVQSPLETYVHPEYGPSYYPDRAFSRFQESFFLGRINQWGYLGEGRPRENTTGELRVALVGDSWILGHTVFERHHFKRVLAADLEAALGRDVIVLNFARADFNLWNMHRYYRDLVAQWDHDLALLFVNEIDLRPTRKFMSAVYPLTVLEGDSLAADRTFVKSATYRRSRQLAPVLSRLATPRMALNLYKLAYRGKLPEILLGKLAGILEPTPAAAAALAPAEPEPLPPTTLAILEDLAADARVQVVLSSALEPATREEIAAIGLKVLDLEPVLDELRSEGIDPVVWPVTGQRGHWNHATHERVGHALAAGLLARERLAGARREGNGP
jgi:hypothetical protein